MCISYIKKNYHKKSYIKKKQFLLTLHKLENKISIIS